MEPCCGEESQHAEEHDTNGIVRHNATKNSAVSPGTVQHITVQCGAGGHHAWGRGMLEAL